ncbi:sulfite reductase [NADPH] flavoprotein alpha-component [Thalassobacillus devorans]|uniref:Sulfite reductase [NADPH] flavoprotein alpha-component n=1 Tax=Thalassobacillus devorans TaxID=279813 RepID=A0ABQ1NPF5_9BACI|nr:assimilatory sulfite reductase (NADPH) flavoprotein subunit [Thalassobacillus devorans]NIK28964.1 sulfite reductase (NADPH) flavoprotein alpha-component [Thalassobacillus devorans]GGC82209.1 sulfite reductase [NADPH] flavoprotein alpha-component [Thalassobacillus devorans]
MQFQVENSPFTKEQVEYLNRLLPTLTEAQKIWLSGCLSASFSGESAATMESPVGEGSSTAPASVKESAAAVREVTVLFGSQTGNGQGLADELTKKLEEKDYTVTLSSMDDFKPKSIKDAEDLLIIASTHGEGDPPDNALSFYEFLHSKRAPKLQDVRFSVLSLGDSSYEYFCQTGKDFDKRLEELGAERLHPRVDCDVDFEDSAEEWFEGVLTKLNASRGEQGNAAASQAKVAEASSAPVYSRKKPFDAEILENLNLNGRGSNKETRHLELDLESSNLVYEPGDSLGIFPQNDPVLVDQLIEAMGWNHEESVQVDKQGELRSVREALLSFFEITRLTKPLLEQAAELTSNEQLKTLLEPERKEDLKEYLEGRDLLDLIQDYEIQASPQEFVTLLRKIPPRLYSIASSLKANPDEVHLTIGALRYDAHGRSRSGVCSVQCAERSQPGDTLPVYIQHNPNFKLPENPDTPIIMIGAGTGVAPYRAFLEEREEIGAEGKTWLFFGEQHFRSDFLYQTEWQKWLKEGVLTRMDVAFSRDTEEKVYVQHRMLEKGKELYQWLIEGAVIYVCGDEKHMAHDVQNALLTVLEQEGGLEKEEAEDYLSKMRQEKRYQRDVY